ncbi:asparagine synthase (glutamine-hydrolyzing) [Candidatus Uhrbacteria bacterium]|nr:asparagine synthase (glutamine-hydrolyzing) [Candidatus Uhrbacteria bacterium]
MCGIGGVVGHRHQITTQQLTALATALTHRGPDDEGIEYFPLRSTPERMVGLVHRRLAIIDLSPAGHQPMRDTEKGNWITFNGEIYNYPELKQELTALGHTFRSQSDTEVILKAYAQWGAQAPEHLRGMFAFAVWDQTREQLFLAVDRFGIKPIYYIHRNGQFAFASELRALVQAGIAPRTIEPLAIESFLAYGSVQAPLTMLAGVELMLPGHTILYDCATQATHHDAYWSPHATPSARSTKEVLLESVRHHLITDVPVALFLSGGMDSSALAILTHEIAGRMIESFSITFAEHEYAEGQYAKQIGTRFCARHHEITLHDSDLLTLMPHALDAMDQPTSDGMNVYMISKAVHDVGIKAVLSGQGGDEIFGGYSTFSNLPRMHRALHMIQSMGTPSHALLTIGTRWMDLVRRRSPLIPSRTALLLESDGSPLSIYCILRQLFGSSTRRRLLGKPADSSALTNGIPVIITQSLTRETRTLDALNATSLFELRLYLANTLLRDGDVMSMAHGLEVRVPFLDHVLLEQVWGTPMREKKDPRLPKPLLLRQVIDQMPREIYNRPKMGFTFPWELWMRDMLRPQIEEVFASTDEALWTFLNRNTCQKLWRDFLAHRKGISWARVWALYVLLSWIQRTIIAPERAAISASGAAHASPQ